MYNLKRNSFGEINSQIVDDQENDILTKLNKTKTFHSKFFNDLNIKLLKLKKKNSFIEYKKSIYSMKKINLLTLRSNSCDSTQYNEFSTLKKIKNHSDNKKNDLGKLKNNIQINDNTNDNNIQNYVQCSIKINIDPSIVDQQYLQYSQNQQNNYNQEQEEQYRAKTCKKLGDGTVFKGICEKGCMIKGQLIFKNGFIYQGQIFLNKFHGKGKLTLPQMQVIQADWIDGQPVNKVTIKYPKGQIYYGQVKKYKRHGKGNLFFTDGSKYQGEFTDGQLTGYGHYMKQNGQKTSGYWYCGDYIGQNQQVFENILLANSFAKSLIKVQNIKNNIYTALVKGKNKKNKFVSFQKEMDRSPE